MPEGDKAAQHQETTGMEQIAQEKRKRHRMAEQTRIQPVPLESMAADGTLTIHEGVVRRSGFHFRIHEPSVCHATRYLRQGKGLAGKMLRGTGLAIRRRRCDNQIKRDSLNWRAQKDWDYTYADYYIRTGRYQEAIPYLRKVIKHEGRRKQRAREWYLMGQLQTAVGNRQAAYKAYRSVIRQQPPYELEFNARIAMTEVMATGKWKQWWAD